MIRRLFIFALFALPLPVVVATAEVSAEDWLQFKFDAAIRATCRIAA